MKEGYIAIKINYLIISLYKTNDDVVAQLTLPHNGSTNPNAIHNKNKLSPVYMRIVIHKRYAKWSLYIMFWAVTITSIDSIFIAMHKMEETKFSFCKKKIR